MAGWNSGNRLAKAEPGCMEYLVKQRGQRTRATATGRKPKVELLARGSEAETGARQTAATMEGVRTAEKSEGQRNWVELTG